jgi:hypothetical protein
MFAKRASNILNNPVPNVRNNNESVVFDEVESVDCEEELSYINSKRAGKKYFF